LRQQGRGRGNRTEYYDMSVVLVVYPSGWLVVYRAMRSIIKEGRSHGTCAPRVRQTINTSIIILFILLFLTTYINSSYRRRRHISISASASVPFFGLAPGGRATNATCNIKLVCGGGGVRRHATNAQCNVAGYPHAPDVKPNTNPLAPVLLAPRVNPCIYLLKKK